MFRENGIDLHPRTQGWIVQCLQSVRYELETDAIKISSLKGHKPGMTFCNAFRQLCEQLVQNRQPVNETPDGSDA